MQSQLLEFLYFLTEERQILQGKLALAVHWEAIVGLVEAIDISPQQFKEQYLRQIMSNF